VALSHTFNQAVLTHHGYGVIVRIVVTDVWLQSWAEGATKKLIICLVQIKSKTIGCLTT